MSYRTDLEDELIESLLNDLRAETMNLIVGHVCSDYYPYKEFGGVYIETECYDSYIKFKYVESERNLSFHGVTDAKLEDLKLIQDNYKHIHKHVAIMMELDSLFVNELDKTSNKEHYLYIDEYIQKYRNSLKPEPYYPI